MDAAVLDDFARLLTSFRNLGGHVEQSSRGTDDRLRWLADALSYLNEVVDENESKEVIQGATLMHGALELSPECFVAVREGELAGAIGFVITDDHIGGTMLGTKQATEGASWALEYEMARVAYQRGIPVLGYYTGPSARAYHLRTGRRLDEKGAHSSEWTVEDCRYLVEGLKDRG